MQLHALWYQPIHPWVIVPPMLYSIYAGIGYARNWQFAEGYNYPYFFLNWGSPAGAFGLTDELPYMGCMVDIRTVLSSADRWDAVSADTGRTEKGVSY